MIPILLLAALAFPPQTNVLVLRSGAKMPVARVVQSSGDRVVFESAEGALYSLPVNEIDTDATIALANAPAPPKDDGTKKLKVSTEERQRLLKELEQNHNGTAPAPLPKLYTEPAPPKPDTSGEEWRWRREAREHEEAVRQTRENLQLLLERVDELKSQINSFISLGYTPRQFSYQTTQLQTTIDQIPYAKLDVERAERALAQFRDDARKQGIMPGWLR